MVPVGDGTLGRIINILGEPIDEQGPVKCEKMYPIHRPSPAFTDLGGTAEQLCTGIKVIFKVHPVTGFFLNPQLKARVLKNAIKVVDLLAPY